MLNVLDSSPGVLIGLLLACALGASWPKFVTMFDTTRIALIEDGPWLTFAAAMAIGSFGIGLQTFGFLGGSIVAAAGLVIGQGLCMANTNRSTGLLIAGLCLTVSMTMNGL